MSRDWFVPRGSSGVRARARMRRSFANLTGIAAATFAASVAFPAPANTLLIGNRGEDTVSFVELFSGRECSRVATGNAPHEIAISPDGRKAAVVA